MGKKKTPKLPLTEDERRRLRKLKVTLSDIHQLGVDQLSYLLETDAERTKVIKALAEFQQVPSIGHKLAEKLVHNLGVCSLEQLKGANPAELFDRLEVGLGCWTDPCVEDQIRCVVHYAEHPESQRQWFDFTEERKRFREMNGYPATRPTAAWYEDSI